MNCKIDAVLVVSPLNWTREQFLFMREQEKGALDWTKHYDQFKAVQIGVVASWQRQGYLDYLASAFLDVKEGLWPRDESWRNRYLADLKCGVRHLIKIGAFEEGDLVTD